MTTHIVISHCHLKCQGGAKNLLTYHSGIKSRRLLILYCIFENNFNILTISNN